MCFFVIFISFFDEISTERESGDKKWSVELYVNKMSI